MRERGRVEVREPLREDRAQLGPAPRLLVEERPRELDHRRQVDVPERGRVLRVTSQLRLEDRLHERTQQQAVVCGDEVDRPAHDADAHDLPALEQLRQRLRPEAVESRPETGVRVVRHLGLHADEVLHGRERRPRVPLEQQLPRERRPVQRPRAQHLVHPAILAHGGTRPERVNVGRRVDKWGVVV